MAAGIDIIARLQAQGLDHFSRSVQNQLRGLSANVDVKANGAGLSRLAANASLSERALRQVQAQAGAASATLKGTVSIAGDLSGTLGNLATQAGLTSRRFLAFAGSVGVFLKVANGLREGVRQAVAFDLALNKVAQVSGDTSDKIADIRQEIQRLSTSLGVSGNELADVAVTFKQAGLSAREVKQALEAVALTDLAPNFKSMQQSTEGLIAVYRQFGFQAGSFQKVLGSLNAVAGDFAVEASDLVTAVQKAGGSFAAVAGQAKPGIDALAEFQGLFTSVRATTRESADSIATGLRTVFTRFQRNDTVQALREYGVNLRYTREEAIALGQVDLQDQFVGAYEAVKRLSSGLQGLRATDPRFSAIVEQLGGYRQISKVIPLLQQQSEAQKAVNVALAGQVSLQISADKRQESLANKLDVLKEKYLNLFRGLVDSKGFQAVSDQLIKIASYFTKIVDAAGPLLPIVGAFATFKIGSTIGLNARTLTNNAIGSFAAPVGSVLKHNSGGVVPGVGSTDTVPSLLTPGEFVINKKSAAALGAATLGRLNRYNAGGFVHRFANGGSVPSGRGDGTQGIGNQPFNLNAAQTALVNANVQLVERVISQMQRGTNGGFIRRAGDDAFSAGLVALGRAAQKFNESLGTFKDYATAAIQHAVLEATNRTLGKGGKKVGTNEVDLTLLANREVEPLQQLVGREIEAVKQGKRDRAEGVLGGSIPGAHKELQRAAKGLGLKAGGDSDTLTGNVGNEVAKRLADEAVERAKRVGNDAHLSTDVNAYQAKALADARAKFGADYGVPGDVLARRDRYARGGRVGAGQAAAFDARQRAENADFVDPLVAAKFTRPERLADLKKARLKAAQAAGNSLTRTDPDAVQYQDKVIADLAVEAERKRARFLPGPGDANTAEAQAKRAARAANQPKGRFKEENPLEDLVGPLGQDDSVYFRGKPGGGREVDITATKYGGPGDARRFDARERIAQTKYQQQALEAAKQQQGSNFGVPSDVADPADRAANVKALLAEDRFAAEQQRRKESQAFKDPLEVARDNRKDRADALRAVNAAKFENKDPNADAYQKGRLALTDGERARERQNQLDLQRRQRARTGVDNFQGAYLPEDIRAKLLAGFKAGTAGSSDLESAKGLLSPTQYRVLQKQALAYGAGDSTKRTPIVDPPSLLNRIGSGASGLFGSAKSGLSGLSNRVNDSRFGRFASGYGGGAALVAAPLLADQLQPSGPAVDSTAYRARAAGAGALQFATGGAAAGAAFGPLGAAIGGVAGGLVGLVSSLREAEQEIRQVKINNALTTFQDKLGTLANLGSEGTTAAARQQALDSVRTAQAIAAEKNRGDATHTFGGFSVDEFSSLQKKSLRNDFGGQLASISQVLQNDADKLGRANIGRSVDELVETIKTGNGGLNKEFISIIANLREIPLAQVEQDIRKNVLSGQRAAKFEGAVVKGSRAEERNAQDFGRFLLAVQASADALLNLKQGAESLSQVFEGAIGSSRVSARADNLDQLGRDDRGALVPLDAIVGATGKAGGGLRDTGRALDEVSRVLPGIIANAVAKSPTNPDGSPATDIVEQLRKQLGASPANARILDSLQRRLEEETANDRGGNKNLFDQAGTDATALSQKLLQAIADPVKDVGGKVAKQLEDNANALVDGLSATANRIRQIGETYDQLAIVQEQKFRGTLELAAKRAGRGNQALDFASLGQLESGFNARQSRLGGASAFDPDALGKQLNAVLGKLEGATQKQQQAFEATGGRGPQFKAAADEVVRLKSSAANLQQALKNLADVSARNAAVQEKLVRLEQEREGRLGLAERYATATPEEAARLNRSALLANAANDRGNLDGFSGDDRRSIVDFLRSAGGTTLTGFNGSPRADDLLKNLLSNSFGGAFKLNPQQAAEERGLQGVGQDRFTQAEKAVQQLIKFQETAADSFFKNLLAQQTGFFIKLEAQFARQGVVDKENKLGDLAGQVQKFRALGGQRDVLAGVGITNTDQAKALQGKRAELDAIRGGYETRANIDTAYGGAIKKLSGLNANDLFVGGRGVDPDKGDVQTKVAALGLNASQAEEVAKRFNKLVHDEVGFGTPIAKARTSGDANAETAVRKGQLQRALQGGYISELDANAKGINEKVNGLRDIKGVDAGKVEDVLRGKGSADFLKALDTFSGGQKLEGLQAEIDKTTQAFNRLNAEIVAIKGGQQGGAVNKAAGGVIGVHPGSPRGSDTVPAWLTPGEFVVNARAAQANLSLLKGINDGVAFRAGGGRIGYDDELKFLAKSDPFGKSSLKRSERLVSAKYLSDAIASKQPRSLADTLAGAVGRGAQNFEAYAGARRNALANGISRPGDDGQKNVSARVFGLQEDRARSLLKNDPYYRRHLAQKNGTGPYQRFADGGAVPGVGSTDSVPALLTPGEFVLNKAAAGAIGLGHLQRFNRGGVVRGVNYLAGGGPATGGSSGGGGSDSLAAFTQLSASLNSFAQQAGAFSQASQQMAQTFNVFAGNATALTQALNNMPKSLAITGQHQVTVAINGAEALSKLQPEIKALVTDQIRQSLGRVFKEQLPDAGVQV